MDEEKATTKSFDSFAVNIKISMNKYHCNDKPFRKWFILTITFEG